MDLSIVILAAGQGTRMRSDLPKVLHKLAGKSLLEHVYTAAQALSSSEIYVVYGHEGDRLKEELSKLDVRWIIQNEQLGTGHAVKQALDQVDENNHVLILYGDIPLITTGTLQKLVEQASLSGFSLLTVQLENPAGYGRIIRDGNQRIIRIVEEKDASTEEKKISEINTGIMVVGAKNLKKWINELNNNNTQKEYYLTDIIEMAVKDKTTISVIQPQSFAEVHGVNDRVQLSEMERYYQLIQAHQLMRNGMTIIDPARFDLRGDLEMGSDIVIDINVILEGRLKVGNRVNIGANCVIKDSIIHDEVVILPNCVIENAVIGKACRVGPFSRIRPETVLDDEAHIGNFVEIKKSNIGKGSKVNHLSYIGDTELGNSVNIGAGTITCNYDGVNKHKTIIEDNVFIGSDTQLIAPVTVKSGATIAAGTTITKDVEADSLAISRIEQNVLSGWKKPKKK